MGKPGEESRPEPADESGAGPADRADGRDESADPIRQKFRQALARKQGRQHASARGAEHDGSDKSHGAASPTQGKPFRRKAI